MTDTLHDIVSSGRCHGCGACAAAVGSQKIKMSMTAEGYLRPESFGHLGRSEQEAIVGVCSGREVVRTMVPPDLQYHHIWGPIASVETGYASDPQVRYRGSSGGVISAICIFLLETGAVDFVLQTSADPNDPIGNTTRQSLTKEDILGAAGSRYAPSSPLADLDKYLAMGKRFAFVGKPCDVASLRRLELQDRRVAELIPFKLAFFCAGVPSRLGTKRVLDKLGVSEDQISEFSYRGRGWPGLTRAVRHDGSEESMDYNSSWGSILNRHLQFRCKVCVEGIGEYADIACADAWYGKDGYPDFTEQDGRSLIVARTRQGHALLSQMRQSGVIATDQLDVEQIGEMQPYQMERRRAVLARVLGVVLKGRRAPSYKGFGLLKLSLHSKLLWLLRNTWGTFKRTPFKGPIH
jgi:coenzyme F420 hydrogenase subunit beta